MKVPLIDMNIDNWLIYKEFRFEAAHRLPHHGGKCCRLHGHSWIGRVYVKSDNLIQEGAKQGMVIDFEDIKKYLNPLLEQFLDHYYLNETMKLESPTCEVIAKWIFEKLELAGLQGLQGVEIQETCTAGARFTKGN
ncbi:MAG: 6-carboxytetrahydropterin synthase QueD [cyanobacterium endosymbiont of Rhopalodia musculus]|uniref:6-carboxytetrahydropterin synthase QueD n=1 Tax=cyanobacterium endosymbiont of Epithemia clementina EcSB TaxID=3034674 RepID=UPI00247FB400|nr:6-carboxytetrahydropterin synthase QueD [cyanobacterium endosymbiont of Epithemia clementina EcSB]WGT67091.1 6-carboxytetrahydropterin synthase QueD [cyanobacterium endosymbiont of Epithemia clementina EcSB]